MPGKIGGFFFSYFSASYFSFTKCTAEMLISDHSQTSHALAVLLSCGSQLLTHKRGKSDSLLRPVNFRQQCTGVT